ncbi:hypothetical protein N657DRAFT_658976 [Parathielavia appendiculata]|uniref:Calcineurin-like phosphoesterase domain-containing protein n=1 Tax=Parathielavia appendiculata TaxID=2587402 RepID=A0AAN6TSQ5_9PEZI|nr:hypothetical protein N657DRAFT_658976 [Parathielavia appendiculata]
MSKTRHNNTASRGLQPYETDVKFSTSPTTFQIVSDLPLETHPSCDYQFKQTAPDLALLGDVAHVADDALFDFREGQIRLYWNVFFLLGNHEPVWAVGRRQTKSLRVRPQDGPAPGPNLHRPLHSVTVLSCTPFSRVTQDPAAAVPKWTVADHVDAHKFDVEWLNAQTDCLFTHHSPTLDSRAVDERHRDSSVASGFATDLSDQECWSNPSGVMRAFGHTHFSCDFVDELGKRVVANHRGYAMGLKADF